MKTIFALMLLSAISLTTFANGGGYKGHKAPKRLTAAQRGFNGKAICGLRVN